MKRFLLAFVLALLIHLLALAFSTIFLPKQEKVTPPHSDILSMRLISSSAPARTQPTTSPSQQPKSMQTVPSVPRAAKKHSKQHTVPQKANPKPKKKEAKPPIDKPRIHPGTSGKKTIPANTLTLQNAPDQKNEEKDAQAQSNGMTERQGTAPGQNTDTNLAHAIVEAAPILHLNSPPSYPAIARKRGYEGTVMLLVLVNQNGQVDNLKLAESSGYRQLDEAALMSVKEWKFLPGKRGDTAISMWVKIPIRFELKQ